MHCKKYITYQNINAITIGTIINTIIIKYGLQKMYSNKMLVFLFTQLASVPYQQTVHSPQLKPRFRCPLQKRFFFTTN